MKITDDEDEIDNLEDGHFVFVGILQIMTGIHLEEELPNKLWKFILMLYQLLEIIKGPNHFTQ